MRPPPPPETRIGSPASRQLIIEVSGLSPKTMTTSVVQDALRAHLGSTKFVPLPTRATVVLVLHNFHTMLSCLRRFENHLCTPGAFAHVKNPRLCMLFAANLHL